jgi:Leucine-rich repeat (LRR) protein
MSIIADIRNHLFDKFKIASKCFTVQSQSNRIVSPNRNQRTIDLSKRRLNKFPSNFECPNHGVVSLNLSSNGLLLTHIGSVLISSDIVILPGDLLKLLHHLRQLDCKDNRLESLPEEIIYLNNLEVLDLTRNPLKTISSRLCPNLKSLGLSECQLDHIPTAILELTFLQSLALFGNEITIVPKEISKLIYLKHLDLSDNQLSVLPVEVRISYEDAS